MSTERVDLYRPVGVATFGTSLANGEPSVGYQQRKGRCYELAAFALLFGSAPDGSVLIHGTMDGGEGTLGRIGHAWLRLPDGRVWEPIFGDLFIEIDWMEYADARIERVYTRKAAQRATIKSGHYGRWHESLYP